jgi:predicted ferric reductase
MFYSALALVDYYGVPFYVSQFVQRETVLLTVSLLIFVVLLSLSNKWSYAHVKWWKQINMLIWLNVPFLFTHFVLAANIFGDAGYFWAPWSLLALSALAGVSALFRAKRDYFAWWRIWLLLGGSVLSALVVWFYPAIL